MAARLRSIFGDEEEKREEVEEGLPPIFVAASPDLIEVVEVPRRKAYKIWSLISKDSALAFLDKEYSIALLKERIIAALSEIVVADPDHPAIWNMVMTDIMRMIDEENIDMLGLLRLSRSKHGFERRLQTITAPRHALRGW